VDSGILLEMCTPTAVLPTRAGPAVKLSITHPIECEHSKFIEAVSGGWPKAISEPEVPAGDRSTVLNDPYSIGSTHSGKE
jgi:hypothetical protein